MLRLLLWKRFALGFIGAYMLLVPISMGQEGGDKEALNIGFTVSTFSNVNVTDALASLKIWANAIMRNKGYTMPAQTTVFDNINILGQAIKAKKLDLVICRSNEFVESLDPTSLVPYFVCTKKGRAEEECLLLVHRLSRIDKWEELAGKEILFSSATNAALAKLWLETMLLDKGFGTLDRFFRKTSTTIKDSQAVLPVFFRKWDVCLVTRSSFETIAELNPQIQNDLKIVAQSPSFAPTLVCIRKGYRSDLMSALVESLRNIHMESQGQQILTLFKTERLLPCEPAYLTKIGQLISRHDQLQKHFQKPQ
jgi:ABC-type phosphate/phosphonate transport system substrate-binding protein